MTPWLPAPHPLPVPPGSVAALGAALEQLAGAGFAAGLTTHLLEPAAVLAGWQGADARAAAAEVGTALALAVDLHGALTAATGRLAGHRELWLAVEARIEELREQQRARFTAAGGRLGLLLGTAAEAGVPVPSAEAARLAAEVAEQDAAAAAEHRALLRALEDDVAATAAVLGAAGRPFGGTGRPGDAVAVTVRLAAQLPGWGSGALADLGHRAADELTGARRTAELDAGAARWERFAAVPGFAEALVDRLGPAGVGWLLSVLGASAGNGTAQPLAGLLAGALGGPGGRSGEVRDAVRLDPTAAGDEVDGLAVAMGLVLAAPGAGAPLAAAWGRQLLAREAARGARAGAGSTGGALLTDPVEAALTALARSGAAAPAAQLLADPGAWTTLLPRPWPGGNDSLGAVVELAATAPGAGRAARSLLLALGEGLAPGSPGRVLDDRGALDRLRPALTGLVAGRPDVVVPVLEAAGTGTVPDRDADTALRGLGHLLTDRAAADEVTAAVRAALQTGDPRTADAAAAVAGAHVAVLEHGQRLRYAVEWAQAQSGAVDVQMVWTLAISLPVDLLPRGAGEVAGAVEELVADVLGADGEVEIGPDAGAVRTAEDAARFASEALGPAAAEPAREGFGRAQDVLGRLAAPAESLLDRLPDLDVPELSRRSQR